MSNAEDTIAELWTAMHGQPPPVTADAATMIEVLVDTLPEPARDCDPKSASV